MANPEHLAKLEEGVDAWNKWREENPSVKPDLSQAHLENARLFRAHLENANLRLARLENANLIGAHLENADLGRAHLENADLNTAHLENAILRRAHLENASLFRAHFENADLTQSHLENAHLTEAHLENADLREADLTNSDVTGLLYTGPASLPEKPIQGFSVGGNRWWNWLRRNPIPYRRWVMRGHYQGIRGLSACHGNRIFVRDATDQDYLDTVERQLRNRWGQFRFWLWGLTDYGRSLMSVVVFASILIFGFGWVYSHWPRMISVGERRVTTFTPYYFSIVTYTTLGFGDVKPNNLAGEILVSVEVILGYLTLGLLLAVLGDKVARRG